MDKELESRIRRFLSEKVLIEEGNTKSVAHSIDVEELRFIVTCLCSSKWQQNKLGYLPVQVEITNRSTHEAVQYGAQPKRNLSVPNQFEYKLALARHNSAIAHAELTSVWDDEQKIVRERMSKLFDKLELSISNQIKIRDEFEELEKIVSLPPIPITERSQ